MDVKPDPKPGRWILPLVIVAMVGFTYVFVNSIQAGDADGGDDGGIEIGPSSTTTFPIIGTSEPEDGGEGPELDPETQAYVDQINGFDESVSPISSDFVAANDAWDDKTATYVETRDAFNAGINAFDAWAAEVSASTPPGSRPELADLHQVIIDASAEPAVHAREALEWLESTEEGTAAKRRDAVAAMEVAVAAFSDAVSAAVAAASG